MQSRTSPTEAPGGGEKREAAINVRDNIIAAAAKLVLERGAARVTLEDVCRGAGVTRTQLTGYFPGETALFRGVLSRGPGVLPECAMHQELRRLDSLDALHAWVGLFLAQQQRTDLCGSCLPTALAWRLAAAGGDARADVGAGFGQWMAMLSACLHRMRDRGELRTDADPDELASGMVAVLQGGILLAKVMNDVSPLRSAATMMLACARSFASPANNAAN